MLNPQAIQTVQQSLTQFAATENFESLIESIFGTNIGSSTIRQQWLSGDFSLIPEIKILSNGELGTANGAYAASLDSPSGTLREQIFVSSDFLAQHQGDVAAVSELLLEEIGHKIDTVLNGSVDSPGDEGAIFRLLASGQSLSAEMLAGLRIQDDHAVITVDGKAVEIEKQDFFGDVGFVVTNDALAGTSGNDRFFPGLGIDVVNGGAGNDQLTIDYSVGENGKGMIVSIGSSIALRQNSNGIGFLDRIDFSNIEQFIVTGTSQDDSITTGAGDDAINSGAGNDNVDGGAGNDTINAGDGDDNVTGGNGVDTLDGGAGNDTLNLNISAQTNGINIANYRTSGINLAGIVAANNFETFNLTTGSGNDTVTQAGVVNNVVIRSNDNLNTGAGDDTINLGLGIDVVNGGAGNDQLTIDYSVGENGKGMIVSIGSSIALRQNSNGIGFLDRIDFSNIEQFIVTGTSQDDSITTGAGDDAINSGAGNDNVDGGAGNDTINAGDGDDNVTGGNGVDTLDGGAGNDTLNLNISAQTNGINIANYRTSGINLAGIVAANNFETFNLTTGSGNDTVTQAGVVNNVVIRSNDNLNTGAGDDTINLGLGIDVVNGGAGNDQLTIDYSVGENGKGMIVSIGSSIALRQNSNGIGFLDRIDFSNIEQFIVTGTSQDDSITTGAGDDTINSGAGNDTINGGGGADTLFGGSGNDTYIVSRTLGGGTVIDDLSGMNGTLTLTGGASLTASEISRSGATLLIDLNQDGIFNAAKDLSIKNFFADSTGSQAGTGLIENVGGLSSSTVLNLFTPTRNDFNGDRKSDILWRSDVGGVALWQMDGATVTAGSLTSTPSLDNSWKLAGTGDFNGDSKSDVLWRNDNGSVALWQMDGATVNASSLTSIPTLDNSWKINGTGDFNGDGKSDVLWRNDNGSVAVWQMEGSTVKSSSLTSTPSLDNSWKINGTGDFNGDGKSDLLWRNDDGSVVLWQMNGANITASSLVSKVSSDWKISGTGDFNGDGKSDLLWRNDNGTVALWQMDGSNITSSSLTSTSSLDSSWKVAAIDDYSGDGKSDLLWRKDSGSLAVWEMNGSTVVSSTLTSIQSDSTSWKIAAPIL